MHLHLGMREALETPPGAQELLQPVFPVEEAGIPLPGTAEPGASACGRGLPL